MGSRDLSGRRNGVLFLSQGIGLRPQPWAWVSRPVGPVGRSTDRPEHSAATCSSSFGALQPGSTQEPLPHRLDVRSSQLNELRGGATRILARSRKTAAVRAQRPSFERNGGRSDTLADFLSERPPLCSNGRRPACATCSGTEREEAKLEAGGTPAVPGGLASRDADGPEGKKSRGTTGGREELPVVPRGWLRASGISSASALPARNGRPLPSTAPAPRRAPPPGWR